MTHRRANRGWRTSVLSQAEALRSEVVLAGQGGRYTVDLTATPATVTPGTASENDVRVARMVVGYLDEAIWFATQFSWPWHWINGSHNESAWARLHVAEELIVELMSPTRLTSYVPTAAFACRHGLALRDPRRRALDRAVKSVAKAPPARPEYVRGVLRDALRASNARNDLRYHRARSLRNLTIAIATFLLLLTTGAVVTGAVSPKALPMCLEADAAEGSGPGSGGLRAGQSDERPKEVCPTGRDHPTGGDVALIALIGMAAASISAARALTGATRRLGPYSPVAAQGTLKIVMGALFAIFGVTLLRAGWVPGVDDVDTGAEIVAWALLFGYAQQALTGLLDQRAEKALSTEQPAPSATDDAAPIPEDDTADDDATDDDAAPDVPADVPANVPADVPADVAADVAPAGVAAALPDNPPHEGLAADGAAAVPDVPDDDGEMAAIDESDAGEPEEMAPPEDVPPPRKAAAKSPARKPAKKPGR